MKAFITEWGVLVSQFRELGQFVGLGLSYLFIFGLIGVAQLLLHKKVLGPSATRKLVHIGVAHWWLIAMLFIDDLWIALIGPVSFIVINYISWRGHVFAAMEHEEPRKNLGTIYFPIALTGLVLLTWSGLFPRWYGLAAILVLGWGDGCASLLGERFLSLQFTVPGGKKSVVGTAAMFAASGLVTVVVVSAVVGLSSLSASAFSAVNAVDGIDGLVGGVGHPGAVALARWFDGVVSQAAAGSWMVHPGDSAVLVGLSRLDGLVRIAAGPIIWQMGPVTIFAIAFIIAATATAVELVTPWGLDNISIPLVVFFTLAALVGMPEAWVVRLAWALGMNVFLAVVAYLKRSVTAGGAVAGAGVGFVIFLSGGGFYWSVLIAFFVSSSVLSRLKFGGPGAEAQRRREARRRAEAMHAKGSRRDGVQVLANGGLAALMAAGHAVTGSPFFMLGFAVALAAANADTWASEIGVMSRRNPVSILTWKAIRPGTSGGVSTLGLIASALGAFFIGIWFAAGYVMTGGWNAAEVLPMVAAITGGGFLGSVIDSVLGASVQAQYWDRLRKAYTERRHDAAGVANQLVRGFHTMNNDAVNALSGLASMAVLFSIVA